MPNREEALRKIFETTAASARLSDEQKRELLAHLDDAVEAKVAAGVPEMDAVGQAFEELGDLKRIAKEFPSATPVVATTAGPWIYIAEHGYALLLCFTFIQMMVVPKLLQVFVKSRVVMPRTTLFLWDLSAAMREAWWVVAVVLLALGWAVFRVRRPGKWRIALDLLLGLGGTLLLGAAFVGVLLPFIALLERMTR